MVLKVPSDPLKKFVLSKLGYPAVDVEIEESQYETALRETCDFIAGYFPREQRLAVFNTVPLQSTYPMPADAYWIQEVRWFPVTTRIDDIFGAEAYLFNVGNVVGLQNILTDYHLLQAYRKTSSRILSTEGHFEVINETVGGNATQQKIRLYPTPKGAFPVAVLYIPIVTVFRSPQARYITNRWFLLECKGMLASTRRKLANIPAPGGGTIGWDGQDLANESNDDTREKLIQEAIHLGEPLGPHLY